MFPGSVNFLGNTSNLWNFQNVKQMFQVPQDQLNLLKNIPGWSVTEKQNSEKLLTSSTRNKESFGKSSENQKLLCKNISKLSRGLNLKNLKKIETLNNLSFQEKETLCFENNFKNILRKSTSLSSINKLEQLSSSISLKRSSSAPNFNDMSLFSSTSDDKLLKSNPLCIIPKDKVNEMSVSLKNKADIIDARESQFTDSAVQCQMSQSNLELPLSRRIELNKVQTHSDNKKLKLINNDIVLKSLNLSATENIVEKEEVICKMKSIHSDTVNVTQENLKLLKKYFKETDESFVSQPIPCAQPQPSDIPIEKISLPSVEKQAASIISDVVSKVSVSPSVKKSHNSHGKRKSKNKLEKMPKKFRSMSEVEILYSENQIKSMIEVMKILNQLQG